MSIQLDFFLNAPPGEATRWIVKRYTTQLVETILQDINDFSLKIAMQEKSLCQLYNVILCVEEDIKPHTEKILRNVVYKHILNEEPGIQNRTFKIAELLGLFVSTDFILPMLLTHLGDIESRSVPRFVSSCLTALSAVIVHSSKRFGNQFEGHMDRLIALIISSDYLESENIEVLDRVMRVTKNMVHAAGAQYCKPRRRTLFKILLQLGSSPQMTHAKQDVDSTLEILAKNCGLDDASDLFSAELESLLKEMKEDYDQWTKHSPQRFIFDMLVRRSNTAVVDFWDEILEIIATCGDREKDFELRIDMLSLCEHFLKTESLHSTIVFYSEIIIKMILVPSLKWGVGIPSNSIRKASIICMMTLLNNNLIESVKLYQNFHEIFTPLKNCLDDDWMNELRFASVLLTRRIMEKIREDIDHEIFKEIYEQLLKRLDDAQDGIRIEAAKTFELFFELLPVHWSNSLYDYCIKNIFIHLDDANDDVRQAITKVLQKGARINPETFLEIAVDCQSRFTHQLLCKNLIDYCNANYKY